MTTPDTKPVTVKILPTAIWIEYDIFGARHVVVQHEGMEAFTFATFNYQYGYTDNASTYSAAMNLARSLGATEPIEQRSRQWAADVDAAQASSVTEPVGGGVVAALRELANVVSIHLGLGTIPGSYGPGLKGMAMSEWIRKALHASLEKSVVALSTHEATQREGGGTVSGAAEAVPWDGKLSDTLQRSLNALRLELAPTIVDEHQHIIRQSFESAHTTIATLRHLLKAAYSKIPVEEGGTLEVGISASEAAPQPIDMILYCPNCGKQHIDAPEPGQLISSGPNAGRAVAGWTNPPHRSHLCHECGMVWRPADVPTNGVKEIKTEGSADKWVVYPEEIDAIPANKGSPVFHLRSHGDVTEEELLRIATPPPAPQPPNANCPVKCESMEQCSGACDFMEAAPQPAVVEALEKLADEMNMAVLGGDLPIQCEDAVDWIAHRAALLSLDAPPPGSGEGEGT